MTLFQDDFDATWYTKSKNGTDGKMNSLERYNT